MVPKPHFEPGILLTQAWGTLLQGWGQGCHHPACHHQPVPACSFNYESGNEVKLVLEEPQARKKPISDTTSHT